MTNSLLAGKELTTPITELTLLTMSIGEHSMKTQCLSPRLQIKVQVGFSELFFTFVSYSLTIREVGGNFFPVK